MARVVPPKLQWFFLGLALALAAAARFWHLTFASQHTDEAFTFAISALPVRALDAAVATRDFRPPLV